MNDISVLEGKTLTGVQVKGSEEIIFTVDDGTQYRMFHRQDCCETVTIDDINGDLNDLIAHSITVAEKVEAKDYDPEGVNSSHHEESFTWTFYKLATIKGYVTIRWYGESNGYYSEEVDFVEVNSQQDW